MKRLLAIAAFVLIPAAAHAQKFDPSAIFDGADGNGDRMISRNEFLAARAMTFPKLDRDGNGTLNSAEYRAGAPSRVPGMVVTTVFSSVDTNRDAAISQAEFNAAATPGFDRADVSMDGVLQEAEIAEARRNVR